MNQPSANDPETLQHIRRVRDALSLRLLQEPEVSLVDIGLDPQSPDAGAPVIRVHLRHGATRDRLDIPAEVEGVAVRVIIADYHLE